MDDHKGNPASLLITFGRTSASISIMQKLYGGVPGSFPAGAPGGSPGGAPGGFPGAGEEGPSVEEVD